MGPLFVILGWLIIVAAFAMASAALVWVGQRRQSAEIRRRRTAVAAALPILVLIWTLPARVIWLGWGALTGLHATLQFGDARSVDLPNGYALVFIDDFSSGQIRPREEGEARITGVTAIGVHGAVVFGLIETEPFVFDTTDEGAAHDFEALKSLAPLRPAFDFPGRSPNLLDDLLWAALWLLPPLLMARRWWLPRKHVAATLTRITHAD